MKELISILTTLYGNSSSAEALLSRAGLKREFIDLSGAPVVFWPRIIEDVKNRKSLNHLLKVAIEDYPEQKEVLGQLLTIYQER